MSDEAGRRRAAAAAAHAQFDWAQTLALALEDEGIPYRVIAVEDSAPRTPQCAVYVAPGELERAREIDREVMLELFPDLPDDFDPARLDTSRCPACQEPVLEGAASCPSCGLALIDAQE